MMNMNEMYASEKEKDPEDDALEELKELIARIIAEKQTGKPMEEIEHKAEGEEAEEEGWEGEEPEENMEEEGMKIPVKKQIHIAEMIMPKEREEEKKMPMKKGFKRY